MEPQKSNTTKGKEKMDVSTISNYGTSYFANWAKPTPPQIQHHQNSIEHHKMEPQRSNTTKGKEKMDVSTVTNYESSYFANWAKPTTTQIQHHPNFIKHHTMESQNNNTTKGKEKMDVSTVTDYESSYFANWAKPTPPQIQHHPNFIKHHTMESQNNNTTKGKEKIDVSTITNYGPSYFANWAKPTPPQIQHHPNSIKHYTMGNWMRNNTFKGKANANASIANNSVKNLSHTANRPLLAPLVYQFHLKSRDMLHQAPRPSPAPMIIQPNEHHKRKIAELSNENNVTTYAAWSTILNNLLNAHGRGVVNQPSIHSDLELRNRNLQSSFRNTELRVEEIKQSWPLTGCSIILDWWVVKDDRTLVNVMVHCPQDSVYLQSLDISNVVNDPDATEEIIEGLINEVGSNNVVQIISCAASPWLDAVAEKVRIRHRSIFWTTSATYCLTLILEKVVTSLGWVRETINQAKKITRLVFLLDSTKRYYGDNGLVVPSKIKACTPFLTLENMLLKKEDLKAIFGSQVWLTSQVGSSLKGREIGGFIADKGFWNKVILIVKATIPIVNFICLINDSLYDEDNPQMGILYETMDQLKETISAEIGKRRAKEFWVLIDEVWDQILHCPLHAAGYFLNPKLIYTEDFVDDSEVRTGLLTTISKIGGDPQTQSFITQQLHSYQDGSGDFERGIEEIDNYTPVEWWRRFGNHCPELQSFAIKILGLCCTGATSDVPNRHVAEMMLSVGANHGKDKSTFVYYNSLLKDVKERKLKFQIKALEIDPSDDWVVGE